MNPDAQTMRRWVAGHHAFFLFIQTLVICHRNLATACESGDTQAARSGLERAVRLLGASETAMRLAADMDPDSYQEIRNSMAPPHVPPGFSGLWSVDHKTLIGELRTLHDRIESKSHDLGPSLAAWREALDRVYRAHACVCERFVGDGPSLAIRSAKSQSSALTLLAALRSRTLKLMPAPSGDTSSPLGPDQ